jgi:tetratricopeptide (TPR) repeat protein
MIAALMLAALVGVYANHFHNAFHFDDFHTIINNPYVHSLSNLPRLVEDPHAFSVMAGHGSFRPLVAVSLAVDYWLAKGANPFWFHVTTFVWFVIQLVLLFLLYESIMDKAAAGQLNRWFALFAAALFGFHPVSAETVNYIIQRAEIYCAVGVLLGLVLYIRAPGLRRTGLYLIPVVAGIFCKAPAAVFAGILLTYIYLFEENGSLLRSVKRSIPAFAVCGAAGALVMMKEAGTFTPGGTDPWLYRLTQPWITLHYFTSLFWPSGLTADSDFKIVNSVTDWRVLVGTLFVAGLCATAWFAAKPMRMRPIAFGVAWFLIALLPTAWAPLSEAENDHRMFFAFVGLTLAVVWAVLLASGEDRRSLAVAAAVVLAVCAYGTYERNRVWRTEESLWRDVTEKSPANGRGFMNYGLSLLEKGDPGGALEMFNRALPLTPGYSLLHINIAIADGQLGRDAEAEQHFREALKLEPGDSASYYYFARWLSQKGTPGPAVAMLERGVEKNPSDMLCRTLLVQLHAQLGNRSQFDQLLAESLRMAPTDPELLRLRTVSVAGVASPGGQVAQTPERLLDISLAYYQAKRYAASIDAARQALRLNPNYAESYNNIAAAENALGHYSEGIRAAHEALRLKPDFALARNNLAWAVSQQNRSRDRRD